MDPKMFSEYIILHSTESTRKLEDIIWEQKKDRVIKNKFKFIKKRTEIIRKLSVHFSSHPNETLEHVENTSSLENAGNEYNNILPEPSKRGIPGEDQNAVNGKTDNSGSETLFIKTAPHTKDVDKNKSQEKQCVDSQDVSAVKQENDAGLETQRINGEKKETVLQTLDITNVPGVANRDVGTRIALYKENAEKCTFAEEESRDAATLKQKRIAVEQFCEVQNTNLQRSVLNSDVSPLREALTRLEIACLSNKKNDNDLNLIKENKCLLQYQLKRPRCFEMHENNSFSLAEENRLLSKEIAANATSLALLKGITEYIPRKPAATDTVWVTIIENSTASDEDEEDSVVRLLFGGFKQRPLSALELCNLATDATKIQKVIESWLMGDSKRLNLLVASAMDRHSKSVNGEFDSDILSTVLQLLNGKVTRMSDYFIHSFLRQSFLNISEYLVEKLNRIQPRTEMSEEYCLILLKGYDFDVFPVNIFLKASAGTGNIVAVLAKLKDITSLNEEDIPHNAELNTTSTKKTFVKVDIRVSVVTKGMFEKALNLTDAVPLELTHINIFPDNIRMFVRFPVLKGSRLDQSNNERSNKKKTL